MRYFPLLLVYIYFFSIALSLSLSLSLCLYIPHLCNLDLVNSITKILDQNPKKCWNNTNTIGNNEEIIRFIAFLRLEFLIDIKSLRAGNHYI